MVVARILLSAFASVASVEPEVSGHFSSGGRIYGPASHFYNVSITTLPVLRPLLAFSTYGFLRFCPRTVTPARAALEHRFSVRVGAILACHESRIGSQENKYIGPNHKCRLMTAIVKYWTRTRQRLEIIPYGSKSPFW